jgi:hypothetical protein
MSHTPDMPVPLVNRLRQVSLVTENFDSTVEAIAGRLGIGPWKCWDASLRNVFDTHRDGRPVGWTCKMGFAWCGSILLEVIQPISGPTIYREYLNAQGEGAQHLLVDTGPKYSDAAQAFDRAGYSAVQGGRLNPLLQLARVPLPLPRCFASPFLYFDSREALGTMLETYRMPFGLSLEFGVCLRTADRTVPVEMRQPLVETIEHVGILVTDLGTATRKWSDVGVTGWKLRDLPGARSATAPLPPVTLELVEPVGSGIYRNLFDSHGPGIQFIGVRGASVAGFTAAGFPVLGVTAAGAFVDAHSAAPTVFLVCR